MDVTPEIVGRLRSLLEYLPGMTMERVRLHLAETQQLIDRQIDEQNHRKSGQNQQPFLGHISGTLDNGSEQAT